MDDEAVPSWQEPTVVRLTTAELVVLSAWLHRFLGRTDFNDLVPDKADRIALWNLDALLEKQNPIVFDHAYDDLLRAARSELTS